MKRVSCRQSPWPPDGRREWFLLDSVVAEVKRRDVVSVRPTGVVSQLCRRRR